MEATSMAIDSLFSGSPHYKSEEESLIFSPFLSYPFRPILFQCLFEEQPIRRFPYFLAISFLHLSGFSAPSVEEGKIALQAAVIRPAIRAQQAGSCGLPVNGPLVKARAARPGIKVASTKPTSLSRSRCAGKSVIVRCSFSSSSNGNGSRAENFNENDEDYVNSSVLEAVEVKSSTHGFMIKMRDRRHLKCAHNNPQSGNLEDYAPHPAIVLKMEDGTGLLLPIIVLEMPSNLLIAAVRNIKIARPTMYEVVKEMVDKMGYEVKLVRVTKRVHEAYFAQLYLTKPGVETENISFDLRPSDAINIAVRCKVPIQVNKYLAYSDGMRVVESGKLLTTASDGLLFTELDRPSGKLCVETKEFDLVRNMMIATVEERYRDAAQWRDKLSKLRAKRNWT